jgi:hypothetical protein
MLSTPAKLIVAVALCLSVSPKVAWAIVDITWGAPSTISGDSDVNTAGSLVYAYNIGDPAVTSTAINGVTFAPFPITDGGTSTTSGSLTVAGFSNEPMSTALSTGSASAPYASLSTSYKAMLGTAVMKSSSSIHFLDLTLLNLNPGQTYTLQVWTNNSIATTSAASLWNFSGNGSQNIDINTTDIAGGVGQYAIGTFTADATSEPFFIHGEPFPTGIGLINGLQLRTAAVPEPTTFGLFGIGLAMLIARRRINR